MKIAKQFKSYNAAKEEVKIVNKYLDTIRTTRGKGITVGTKTINKVTQNEILQLEKLGISKEIINQLQRGSGSMTSTAFQKTIATVEKTSKGFYKVNPAGKTIKFYNNQLTMTFLKDGKSVTFTFVSTSKKPLTAYREPLKSFFKYGTNKQIITGVPADGFTAISMSRFWGGEARGTRSFLAKETTEDLTEAMIKQKLRQVDIRETKGIEKYTDDFAEAFGFSPRVSKKVFKTKGGKITEPFVDVSIDVTKPSRAILTTQMGTQQPFVGKGVTITEPIVGDPFLNLLVRKQSIIKKTAVKPKVIKIKPPPSTEINMLNLIDDTITKGGKPITTKVIKPVTKPTRDIISAQEAATQSFVFTDIKTRTPTFKEPPPSKFSNLFLGEGKFGTLGTIDTGFEFKEDKKIIPQDKISLSADSKIKIDTSAKVIAGVKVKPGTKENVKPSLGLTGFESMSMPGVEEGIKESQLVSPVVLSKVTTKEITKSELTQPEISVGGTGGIGGSDFLFPEETTRFKIPIDLDLGGPSFRKGERTGFNAFVKSKGKYKQVTDKPYNRFGAMDIGSRIVDNTTSAQFKIEPIKQTKVIRGKKQELIRRFQEDELAKGDGYYDSTKSKFRNFAIRRGQKIIQQNKWIEKKNKRSDTPGEKRGLSVAQFTSRQSKIKLGLPTRRTKSTKNKRKGYFRL